MLLRLNFDDSTPLYSQIAAAINRSIRDGEIKEGENLPTARELAKVLDVNMHTVLRAYSELAESGVIDMRRGRGSVVREGASSKTAVLLLVTRLVEEGRRQGFSATELGALVEKEMS